MARALTFRFQKPASSKKEIEGALGSVGRIRIIATLAKDPEECYTVYSLAKKTKMDRTKLGKTVAHLIVCGWIEMIDSSTVKKYRINSSNSKISHFVDFLSQSGYYD